MISTVDKRGYFVIQQDEKGLDTKKVLIATAKIAMPFSEIPLSIFYFSYALNFLEFHVVWLVATC